MSDRLTQIADAVAALATGQSDRYCQIALVVAALASGGMASYEAVDCVIEIMHRHCEITDPTPQFTPEERETIISCGCPLFVAVLKEVLPDHLPEVDVTIAFEVTTTGYVN